MAPARAGWTVSRALRRRLLALLSGLVALIAPFAVRAQNGGFTPSVNDFGSTGLLQMPNARFHPDGEINLGVSHISPYTRGYLTLQGLPWLEGTFRYTDIANRPFSNDPSFSGDQSFKDRSVDLKVRLTEESAEFGQVALYLRDIGGTDLFGSEFLVASRRYYNWDFTVGLAWGNGGSRGHLPNPFTYLADSFETRGGGSSAGGFSFDLFHGEHIALFGGIEYLTPIEGLRVKLEYDGNDYQNEPLGNRFDVDLPVNFGIEYNAFDWIQIAAAFERGNSFMIRGNLRSNLNTDLGVPKRDEPPPEVPPRPRRHAASETPAARDDRPKVVLPPLPAQSPTETQLVAALRRSGLAVRDLAATGGTVRIRLATNAPPPALESLASGALLVTRAYFDPPVEKVVFIAGDSAEGAPPATFRRSDLEQSVSLTGSPVALVEPPDPRWLARFRPQARAAKDDGGRTAEDRRAENRRIALAVFREVRKQGFQAEHFAIEGARATLYLRQNTFRNPAQAIGRAARAVAAHAPPEVEEISIVITEGGVPVTRTTLMRRDLEDAVHTRGSPEEMWENTVVDDAPYPDSRTGFESGDAYPKLSWAITPQTRVQIGGPDDFFFFQLYGRGAAEARLLPGLSVTAALGVNIYNNFDALKLESNSQLPRVRSDIARYLKEGQLWLDELHMDYIAKLAPELYGRASVGIFELMFGGVGGELLYRPVGRRWAVGADLNYVAQRDFDGQFGFQDYRVLTGHVSYYHRLPFYDILATVRAGRYLAGDYGGTLELSRTFANGTTFGIFATKTNVSAEEFGEGRFDKGFFISIPLELFFDRSFISDSEFRFRPVTRDGGQLLLLPKPLYEVTDGSDYDRISRGWKNVLK